MPKKKKMIDIDDLLESELEQELSSRNSDMVFISATEEHQISEKEKVRGMSRLERIQSTAVKVDEPLFDGETDLDLGKITIENEEDAQRIQKNLLEQQQITKDSENQRDIMVEEMHGEELEDIIEDSNLDVNILPPEAIDRKAEKKANSRAVQQILDDLQRK
jgi:hypothetical protein